jgi:hypothetical protein
MADGPKFQAVVERNHWRGLVDLLPLNDLRNLDRDDLGAKAAGPGSDDRDSWPCRNRVADWR